MSNVCAFGPAAIPYHVWIRFAVDKGDERMMGIYAKTPAICSCPYCGNPRRHWGDETRQEIAAWLALAESAFEFWNNEADGDYDNLQLHRRMSPDGEM